MNLLSVLAGVSLVLLGVHSIQRGLQRAFGERLQAWVQHMCQRTWSAAVAGVVFGVAAPSSTAQTVLTLQLLKTGRVAGAGLLVFLLAANLGVTLKVQLIAFHLFSYYPVLLVIAIPIHLWSRREAGKGVGQAVLGLALVFLAMEMISVAAHQMTSQSDLITIMGVLTRHPWLLMVFAAGLTVLTQSSTATIALGLGFMQGAPDPFFFMVPVVLGVNVGVGLTTLIVGAGSSAGRALAGTNLLLRILLVVPIMMWLARLTPFLTSHYAQAARAAADLHSGFGLLLVVAGALLGAPLAYWLSKLVYSDKEDHEIAASAHATHLDPQALGNPSFALGNAAREVLTLLDVVKTMLCTSWRGYEKRDTLIIGKAKESEARVDDLYSAIRAYLSQIPANLLTPRESHVQFGLLHFTSQLETIADLIDKSLCHHAFKHFARTEVLSPEDQTALAELERRVIHRFDLAIVVMSTRDENLARTFLKEGDEIKGWCIEAERAHYARAQIGQAPGNGHFVDMLGTLRRISGHLNAIGHTFNPETADAAA